jgi:DNA-binding CsgD family transcriptional regulator
LRTGISDATPVELEIQQFLAAGQTNEQIALILNLRLDVVISYRSSIKKKSLAKLKAALYDLRQPRK